MNNRFAIVVSLLFVFLIPHFAYAAIPPSAYLYVLYDGNEVSDAAFYGDFLVCEAKEYQSHQAIVPQLEINQYDAEKDCYWKPPAWEYRWSNCRKSKCDFFPIPYGKTRLALYIQSVDKVFITNEINADADKNEYNVELSSNGSAIISATSDIEMGISDNTTDTGEIIPSPQESNPYSPYLILFLFILVFIGWILRRIMKAKK
ncbi:hypothetical protein HY488_01865 [Candidatus Woesearchaeota archaeon]|nr:hypothetical protein [Candidatus Woesearchaeota archaeon]